MSSEGCVTIEERQGTPDSHRCLGTRASKRERHSAHTVSTDFK